MLLEWLYFFAAIADAPSLALPLLALLAHHYYHNPPKDLERDLYLPVLFLLIALFARSKADLSAALLLSALVVVKATAALLSKSSPPYKGPQAPDKAVESL